MAITTQFIHSHIVNRSDYLRDIDKVNEDDLYYLKDTGEIYKGSTPFTSSIELYNGNDILLPEDTNNIANNRIYFNTNTLEGKVYDSDNGQWVTIIKPLGEVVDTNTSNPVSGKSVIDYVSDTLGSYNNGVISKIENPVDGNIPVILEDGSIGDSNIVSNELKKIPEQIDELSKSTSEIKSDLVELQSDIYTGFALSYIGGVVSVDADNKAVITLTPIVSGWSYVGLDVTNFIGKTLRVITYSDRRHGIVFADDTMGVKGSVFPDTGNPNLKFETDVVVPAESTMMYINHYDSASGDVEVYGYKTLRVAIKEDVPKVTQESGDSENDVMSQKAVTDYVESHITTINIEPVLTVYNKIPTVDSEVALYLDNMFIGISPREAKLVTSQNAHIRFYDKTVAVIPNATESGAVRLHLNDDTQYQVSKILAFESTTQKSGNKNVLFIGDSMTENLCYIKALKTISDAGDYKLTFLGTQSNSAYPDLLHEGRGGWAAYNYCNNDVFSNKTNAFWDGSKFNFSWYMQNSGIDVPDYIFINLGTNDMIRGIPSGSTDEEMEEIITTSYQTIIESIREYSNTIPIVLWLPPTRSLVGRNNHIAIDKCLRANKWLINKFDNKKRNRIYLMHTYLFVNPYTDYPTITTTIDGVEYMDGTEAIHPSDAGGEKIAKGIIRQMMYIDGLIS